MIPAVAVPTVEAPARAGGSDVATDGSDFLSALQNLAEQAPSVTTEANLAGAAALVPATTDGVAPHAGAALAESLAPAQCSSPLGTDPGMLCAMLGLPAADLAPRATADSAAEPLHEVDDGATLGEAASRRAGLETLRLSLAAGPGDALTVPGSDAEPGMDAAAAAREAHAVAAEQGAARTGTVGESASFAARLQAEPTPRAHLPPLGSPVATPQWNQEFAARVSWLVDRGDQSASIRLSPEQLGPVEVRLAVREGEASIWFGAAHAETRAAIEQALPRLREMLAGMGLSLADAGVFQHAPPDPKRGFVHADARRAGSDGARIDGSEAMIRYGRRGLIDDYA